jgi:DNA-binding response OmpR family regulator
MAQATILVADDSPEFQLLITTVLERAGHMVATAADGHEALRAFYERRPDLVVLDVDMPSLDGWSVLERIREVSDAPVLMLTGEDAEVDKVRGLRGGADDYVTKPFVGGELVARIEALLRRSRGRVPDAPDVTRLGSLEVDRVQRIATVDGRELTLTPLEFRLLAAFARNPRQVLGAERLAELVWDEPYTSRDQVKLLVGRLRRKLAGVADAPEIETVRGSGYRLNPRDD